MNITIALSQIDTRLGDIPSNLELHLAHIHAAERDGADLVLFPELSLTGYCLQDLAQASVSHPGPADPAFGPLLKASKKIDIAFGFVDRDARGRLYIAQAYLSRREILHVHHKLYLPTYGMFDEGRFFAPGQSLQAFDTRFGRLGMLICEDFWHVSPPYLLWLDGADLLLLSSASPGRGLSIGPKLESARWVEHINQAYAGLFTAFVAHANRVGFEDGFNFWGGSTVFGPDGSLLAQGPYHEQALTFCQLDLAQIERTRARLPLLRDERPELVRRTLERILSPREEG